MYLEKKLEFWLKNNCNVLLRGRHGCGKCLGRGTPILMYDGTILPVEEIKTGDLIMGPDSKPRKVLSTCRGKEDLYKVTPKKGDPYIVNSSHILSLKMCSSYGGFKKNEIININVEDFQRKSEHFKSRALGYRVGVKFPTAKLPVDPYFVGLWLGDGSRGKISITNTDPEIIDFIYDYAEQNNLGVNKYDITYSITSGRGKGFPKKGRNQIRTSLKKLGILEDKFIPTIYKTSDTNQRLSLLAGLLDADGYQHGNCYDIITKFEVLATDLLYLARSLGFAAYKKTCQKSCKYKDQKVTKTYYRISISGDLDKIPVKIARKICQPRRQIKDVLKTSIKVTPLGVGDYFGFEIDGDHLFLLGDFTVTHNTAMIKQTFEQAGLKWMYFSCSTMDPWVDFIGVPKEVKDGDKSYLDLVRPKVFQEDEVEALFFDEFNRAPKKVRNAVMELIQFKSINGKKFSNLKVVWAAINPSSEDEAYDVEELDPAQIDRFQVNIEVPCVPHGPYFKNKYGQDWAEAAITWWRELDANVRKSISPRRLDYALEMFKVGGDMKDVLPANANVSKLLVELVNGPITKKLKQLFESNNVADSKKFLSVENNYAACIDVIIKNKDYVKFFVPVLAEEKISSLIVKHRVVEDFLFNDFAQFEPLLQQIAKAGNKRITARVNSTQEFLRRQKLLTGNLNGIAFKRYYNINADSTKFDQILKALRIASSGTQDRKQNYLALNDFLPQKLTPDQVELCLSIVSDIVCHSHKQTLSHYANLIGMLNHILACQIENGGVPTLPERVTEILKGHSTFLLNIASKQALAPNPSPTV